MQIEQKISVKVIFLTYIFAGSFLIYNLFVPFSRISKWKHGFENSRGYNNGKIRDKAVLLFVDHSEHLCYAGAERSRPRVHSRKFPGSG